MTRRIVEKKRALDLIERFSGAKVLVVGDLMVDHFIWGRVSRVSPEAPVPVVEVAKENLTLGGSGNVLSNIVSAGGRVLTTGVIGTDEMGRWLINALQRMNVDTEGLIVEKERPTTVKTRIVAHSQQMVRFDRESRDPVRPKSIEKMIRYIESVSDGLRAIVISDYKKGVVSQALLDGIRKIASEKGIMVFVDPKRNDFSIYSGFDVITPNHHEALRAVGMDGPGDLKISSRTGVLEIGDIILKKFCFRAVLITRGEEGMDIFEQRKEPMHISAVAREVYDVTGAGDTVIGVFSLAMASGASFREAAVLANHAAGIVVGKVGTATVSQSELKKVL
jgi:D-glycero-beta-D-manno-heptose-7-phosphate kinase